MTDRSWTRRHFLSLSTAALGIAGMARPAAAANVIRWATVLATSHPFVAMMERVARQVKEDTAGSLEIQLFRVASSVHPAMSSRRPRPVRSSWWTKVPLSSDSSCRNSPFS
jgi:TRAP-type mannitol/chloroaromatic compound transport system substrate-binding protein